jgi:hypothetical protein
MKQTVFQIRDNLVRIQIRKSVTLTNGSGSSPDPALFVSDLQDAKKIFKIFFFLFSFYSLNVPVHLRHSSKIKSFKEFTKQ